MDAERLTRETEKGDNPMLYNDTQYVTIRKRARWRLEQGWFKSAVADLEELVAVACSKDPEVEGWLEQARQGAEWRKEHKMPATPVSPMQYKEVPGGTVSPG